MTLFPASACKGGAERGASLTYRLFGAGILEIARLHLAALVLLGVVGDALAFAQRGHARALDVGDVDERVGSAAFGLDKAKAFGFVEELDCSCGHFLIPSLAVRS